MPFKVLSNQDGTVVMPENPFSITDKTAQLQKDGFRRILIDFSRTKVTRAECKMVVNSIIKSQPIPETGRFNWKDGFYNPEKMEAYKAAAERQAAEKAEMASSGRYNGYGRGGRKNGNFNSSSGYGKNGGDKRKKSNSFSKYSSPRGRGKR